MQGEGLPRADSVRAGEGQTPEALEGTSRDKLHSTGKKGTQKDEASGSGLLDRASDVPLTVTIVLLGYMGQIQPLSRKDFT